MAALTASLLKHQIEAQLAHRIPAALSPMARQEAERQPLRDPQLNELLGGGVPVGAITELHGEICSGRTSVALSLAAAVTATDRVAAWVDVNDELDPETAALCGVDLEQLLWIRCGKPVQEAVTRTPAAAISKDSSGVLSVKSVAAPCGTEQRVTEQTLVVAKQVSRPIGSGGHSPHPRGEGRGMSEAIDALLQRRPYYAAIPQRRAHKQIGTPGMPNRNVMQAPQQQWVSHHAATVIQQASRFQNGKPSSQTEAQHVKASTGNSKIVSPEEIVPTHGSLFGRQVGRNMDGGSTCSPSSTLAQRRPPMPFPNASPYREEQIPTDRQPSRRAQVSTAPQKKPRVALERSNTFGLPGGSANTEQSWTAVDWAPLDQALRSVDLLLQVGGFSLLVLDLSSVPADKAWRIPLATWFRFRAGCERSRCSLVVLSRQPCARASADLTVALRHTALHTMGDRVITGGSVALELEQQRRGTMSAARHESYFAVQSNVVPFRKPVRSDHHGQAPEPIWKAGTHWSVRA